MSVKELPNALSSERSILSLMMQEPETWVARAIGDGVEAVHFYVPAHRSLYERMTDAYRDGRIAEIGLMELTERMGHEGTLEAIGGRVELSAIYTYAASGGAWSTWVQRIRSARTNRLAIEAATELQESAYDPTTEPERLQDMARMALESLTASLSIGSATLTAKEASDAFLSRLEALATAGGQPGLSTNLPPLDLVTGGPRPGELWTIAGETSGGKSVLMLQIAGEAVRNGLRVLVFSLEMGADEVVARIAAGTFNADFAACNNPCGITRGQMQGIQKAVAEIVGSGLMVNDAPEINADGVCVEAERQRDRGGLDLVVVDYLQLLDGQRRRNERQDEEISRNVKRLKQLAKKLHVPVLTASQLNDEGRLFAARAIGHHSDVVLKIKEDGILVNKNRNGRRGDTLPLFLVGERQRFIQKHQ